MELWQDGTSEWLSLLLVHKPASISASTHTGWLLASPQFFCHLEQLTILTVDMLLIDAAHMWSYFKRVHNAMKGQ